MIVLSMALSMGLTVIEAHQCIHDKLQAQIEEMNKGILETDTSGDRELRGEESVQHLPCGGGINFYDQATQLRIALAFILSFYMAFSGYKKNRLSFSGACSAVFVGLIHFGVAYRMGAILIAFYYTSSKLTKLKEDVKARYEEGYKLGGQRSAVQVLSCSILATVVAVVYGVYVGEDGSISFAPEPGSLVPSVYHLGSWSIASHQASLRSYLWCSLIAHYAVCTGDTWSSELGILSSSQPRLVTSLFTRSVPHGTNGGVSFLGTLGSILGGLFIGLLFWGLGGFTPDQFPAVPLAVLSGFIGSLIDSLLGATLQSTYYHNDLKCIVKEASQSKSNPNIIHICGLDVLSNEAVNLLSTFITMVIAVAISPFFFAV